jgi:hypothetical protein
MFPFLIPLWCEFISQVSDERHRNELPPVGDARLSARQAPQSGPRRRIGRRPQRLAQIRGRRDNRSYYST